MDLRRTKPGQTYPYLINTDNDNFYDGTGSLVTNIVRGMVSELIPADINTLYNATVNQTFTMPTYITNSHCNTKISNKLYGGTWTRWRYVLADPDNDLTNFTASHFSSSYNNSSDFIADAASPAGDTSSIYYVSSTKVYKVETNNFTSGSILYDGTPTVVGVLGSLPTIEASGTFVYVGTQATPAHFLKINTSNGSLVQDVTWTDPLYNGSVPGAHSSTISDDNKWVYFGTFAGTTGGVIAKVSTEDITNYTSSGPLWKYAGDNPVVSSSFDITDDMCYLKGHIYAASEAGLSSGSLSIVGYNLKLNADTLITSSDNRFDGIGNSFGMFTDGVNVYKCLNGEGTCVYLNGDLNSPRRFTFQSASNAVSPNEMWFTDGGRIIVSDWPGIIATSGIQWISLPVTRIGIDTVPSTTLDVAGALKVSEGIRAGGDVFSNTNIQSNTLIFTSSLSAANSNNFRLILASTSAPRLINTGSITGSLGFFSPNARMGEFNGTGSVILKAINSSSYFSLSILDAGGGVGTLVITQVS